MKSHKSLYVLCFVALSMILLPQAAHAQCSLASFVGSFYYQATGVPGITFGSADGTLTADGLGGFTNVETTYSSNTPDPHFILVKNAHTVGTYLINSDCTGGLIFHPAIGQLIEIHVDIILDQALTGFYGVGTDQPDFEGYTGTQI
jgi:hypothetical protein